MTKFRHPEQRVGEVWLTNSTSEGIRCIVRTTKRVGKQAYDINSVPVSGPNFYPVFVQYGEMLKAGYVMKQSSDKLSLQLDEGKASYILPYWKIVLASVQTSKAGRSTSRFREWSKAHTPQKAM